MRLFIASSLAPALYAEIDKFLGECRGTYGSRLVRWVNPTGIHLTYKFLGDTLDAQVPAITDTLDEIGHVIKPFPITIKGLGCFPNCSRPRVFWLGVHEESNSLLKMQDRIERGLVQLGFPGERRAFHPHLTLGRVRRGLPKSEIKHLGESWLSITQPNLGVQNIEGIELIKSDLLPAGAKYTTVHRSELRGGSG